MADRLPFRRLPLRSVALTGLVAFVMIGGGIAHLASPHSFVPLVPRPLPAMPIIITTGIVQIAIGLATIWRPSRALGAAVFAGLCLAYMPLHLWDFFRPDPVFSPPVAATVRVAAQALLVWAGITLSRDTRCQFDRPNDS